MRLCKHCGKYLTYPVYKKHKEEFYNSITKEWIVRGFVKSTMYSEEVDAEDDEIIRDSLGAQGTKSCIYLRIQLIYISQLQLDYIGHFIAVKRLHIHSNEHGYNVKSAILLYQFWRASCGKV